MKADWSNHWKSSSQPRKQRKYRYNAPLHVLHKFLSAPLSKELRKKYSKRSIPLRKGDTVKICNGSFKDMKGKIEHVYIRKSRVSVENVTRTKKDGTKIPVLVPASIILIEELNLSDKQRLAALTRK
ncbi:50S ribosomal protein L24 [Candidatus Woesearchaeota archaeon]|nr:50S ribosomal protein L24 [Candidatus Woesearchaeota archaeon]